jgi:hypothetical protein
MGHATDILDTISDRKATGQPFAHAMADDLVRRRVEFSE